MTVNPTAYEQYLLELVNWARANPLGEANLLGIDLNQSLAPGTISPTPKQPLVLNAELISAARGHSQWMLATDTFSHTGINGSTPRARIEAAGYKLVPPWSVGENIAWNGTTGSLNLTNSVLMAHEGLFRSAGHRVNLMNGDFKEVGLGVIPGQFTVYNAGMVTQKFAYSGYQSYLTGVILDDLNGNSFYDVGEGVGGVKITAMGTTGTFTTHSWGAGGYNLALPNGSYTVTYSFGGKELFADVLIAGKNVKVDVFLEDMGGGGGGGGGPGPIYGTSGHDDLFGTAGNDLFIGSAGHDFIDGGPGIDTVIYSGPRGHFWVSLQPDGDIIIDKPNGVDVLVSIERVEFSNGTLLFGIESHNADAAYRLYGGAFDRTPDEGGFLFWVHQWLDIGRTLHQAAAAFIASPEFISLYGTGLSNSQFVNQLYFNVLGRPGEQQGVEFWNSYLNSGAGDRAMVLVHFTQLPEYVGTSLPDMENGYWVI
jgi:hypothetical protein